jgi:23S rRNA pseudouridine1911/1915/1917 synthase
VAGARLDRILAARTEHGWSRTTVQRFIDGGRVDVDGRPAKRRDRPPAGARIIVRPEPPPPTTALPEPIPLTILHEDDDLLVIDKPAGLVVHPAPGHPSGTLVNALLHPAGLREVGGDTVRPGIVHRLDKETSGVMVVARTAPAREALVAQFKAHSIDRVYQAIAIGAPPDRVSWETLHGRHPRDRKRFTTRVRTGKRAVTHLRVLERLTGAALVACTLETGRTHQIRVHLAEHGTPVLGDKVYGRAPADPVLRDVARALGRQALHAAVLGFVHPTRGERLRFETAPPSDFRRALDQLRRGPGRAPS